MTRNHHISISSLLGTLILHKFYSIHTIEWPVYLHELAFDYEIEANFSIHTETTSVGNIWRKTVRLTRGLTLGKAGSQTTGAVQFKTSVSNDTNVI